MTALDREDVTIKKIKKVFFGKKIGQFSDHFLLICYVMAEMYKQQCSMNSFQQAEMFLLKG